MYRISRAFPYALEVSGNDGVELWIAGDAEGVAAFYGHVGGSFGGAEGQVGEGSALAAIWYNEAIFL